jgi:Ser/Thr protein kinase RdoA (MazF antagonist)
MFRASAAVIARVMDDIGEEKDGFGLIHADLHFGNVVFASNDMHAIDFDECGPGYWVYDIATALRPWRFDVNWDIYFTAFRAGYARIAQLPPGTDRLDLFIIARHLATTLWAASRVLTNTSLARSLDDRCAATAAAIDSLTIG